MTQTTTRRLDFVLPSAFDPQVPGGRYFCGYWAREYIVDTMYNTVHWSAEAGRWIPGTTWYVVTWVPSEDALHPRASAQWRGEGYRPGKHCTAWEVGTDQVVRASDDQRAAHSEKIDPITGHLTLY